MHITFFTYAGASHLKYIHLVPQSYREVQDYTARKADIFTKSTALQLNTLFHFNTYTHKLEVSQYALRAFAYLPDWQSTLTHAVAKLYM